MSSPAKTQKFNTGLNWFCHICCPDGLNNSCSLTDTSLKMVPTVGTVGRACIPRIGEGVRSLLLSRSSSRVSWQSHCLDDLLQHCLLLM